MRKESLVTAPQENQNSEFSKYHYGEGYEMPDHRKVTLN